MPLELPANVNFNIQNVNDVFNLPDDKFGCSLMFLGSTRSGKTTMLNYVFKQNFRDYISVLMSNSLNSDAYDYLKKFCLPSDFYHPEVLKDMYKINHATNNHYRFMAVIDDIPDKSSDSELARLLTIYRNSRISCCVCIQAPTMLKPVARNNINFVFCGRLNSDYEIERTVKNFVGSYFPRGMSMEDKIKLYRYLTEDHCFLVVDNINGGMNRVRLQPGQLIGV